MGFRLGLIAIAGAAFALPVCASADPASADGERAEHWFSPSLSPQVLSGVEFAWNDFNASRESVACFDLNFERREAAFLIHFSAKLLTEERGDTVRIFSEPLDASCGEPMTYAFDLNGNFVRKYTPNH